MKIILGSKSDKKRTSVIKALDFLDIKDYELECIGVSSDVSENPLNDEIIKGAKNRNKNLKRVCMGNNLYISIEAGFKTIEDEFYVASYCVIEDSGIEYVGEGPMIKITSSIYNYVKNGNVLHLLIQELQHTETNEGVVGFLSNGTVNRNEVEEYAVIDAFNKMLNKSENIELDVDNCIDINRLKELDEATR